MRFVILALIGVVLITSCSKEDTKNYKVGGDFVVNDIRVRVIDTFTLNTGTYKLDSLITSGVNPSGSGNNRTGHILLGSIDDPNLGKTVVQSYFQINGVLPDLTDDYVYDSIGFVLNYDTYYTGDTLKPQTYKIHRVLEDFKPNNEDDGDEQFYNISKLKFDKTEVLGTVTFTPSPKSNDSVYIPMKYELGKEIFNKIKNKEIKNVDLNNQNGYDQNDFTQYFKGLTIIPDTLSNSHVLGFSTYLDKTPQKSSSMRLYYTFKNIDNVWINDYIEFTISDATKQFNAVKLDISKTSLKEVEKGKETIVSSKQTNNLFYAQAGSGICARINIPSIKKLKNISELGTSLSAELTFKPLKTSYGNVNSLPQNLGVYIIDSKNRNLNSLTDITGQVTYAVLRKSNDEFDDNTYYSVDLSGFLETILQSKQNLDYSLMIQFLDFNSTVDKIVIQNPSKQEGKVKLAVKYLNY